MFKTIAIVVVVLIAGVLAYAAIAQPDTFRVQRTASIKASPEKIYAVLNDFQKSMAWSPFEKKDPAMARKFSGPAAGKGSVYEFEGNKEIGAGRLEIIESVPARKVALTLDMHKPFEAKNIVEYTLEPKDGATEVTWAIHGPMNFVSKVMCLFLDMDKMVGKDFEQGLSDLKILMERS
jgi:uncharacterized protein YndB with AHSA1/START domain